MILIKVLSYIKVIIYLQNIFIYCFNEIITYIYNITYLGEEIDTTDRSLVTNSIKHGYDKYGTRHKKALLKEIFYTDPYITCSNCNYLNFIDVITIRRMLALENVIQIELKLKPEILPPCIICDRADCFMIGSHDFSKEVAERKRFSSVNNN